MSRKQLERRLKGVSSRLKEIRDEIGVADEQFAHLADAADDARLRALVAETPVAGREHADAERHAEVMRRHRQDLIDEISRLETLQDELLDRLVEAMK